MSRKNQTESNASGQDSSDPRRDPRRDPRWDPRRFRQPSSVHDRRLNLAAIGWLKELPSSVAPVELARQFPRIVNRLARFWDSPGMVEQCFRDLLVQQRAGRQGFPANLLAELFALEQHFRGLHGKAETDTWESVPDYGSKGSARRR